MRSHSPRPRTPPLSETGTAAPAHPAAARITRYSGSSPSRSLHSSLTSTPRPVPMASAQWSSYLLLSRPSTGQNSCQPPSWWSTTRRAASGSGGSPLPHRTWTWLASSPSLPSTSSSGPPDTGARHNSLPAALRACTTAGIPMGRHDQEDRRRTQARLVQPGFKLALQ